MKTKKAAAFLSQSLSLSLFVCACAKNKAKNLIYASTKAMDAKKGSDIVGQTPHSTFTALCSSHTLSISHSRFALCTKIAKLSGYRFKTVQTSAFFFIPVEHKKSLF